MTGWFSSNPNQQQLLEALSKLALQPSNCVIRLTAPCADMQQNNVMAMMVSLQRRLDHLPDDDREGQFFLACPTISHHGQWSSGGMENWMITSYEVEFGHQIGSGGLCVFVHCHPFYCLWTGSEFTTAGWYSQGLGIRPRLRSRC